MKPDYKNWMPKGMIWSFAAGTALALVLTIIVGVNWLRIFLLILTLILAGVTVWTVLMETLRVLKKGGTFAIHDLFSRDKYGDMQAFVKNLKNLGYEQVELIPTDSGRFMSPREAKWMACGGATDSGNCSAGF